jgi:CubicO group peptidase (beta-lactamase class C family)
MKTPQTTLLLLLCLFTTSSYASDVQPGNAIMLPPSEKIEALIDEYDNDETPGGVVLVMRNGEVIYTRAFGMANLSYKVPFAVNTPTNIGSTSKQFTAFAIGLLEEQGLLSLDDDIRKHIPELPSFSDTIRLWHLISHTNGYREYLNTFAMGGRQPGDLIIHEEIIPMLQRQPELQNTPGDLFNYNNTGYALLAMTVERITGTEFPQWMRENVFLPLGMTSTYVLEHHGQVIPGSAQGYGRDANDNFIKLADLSGSMGPGGIYSTAEDLAKWVQNFYVPKVGSQELIEKMQTSFVKNDGEELGYAFGLMIDENNGLQRIYHGGADIAHRSELYMYPEIKGAVITQSNNSRFPGNVALKTAEAFFADVMDLEDKEDVNPDDFKYDPEKFDELAGRYELEAAPGFILEFTRESDTLFTQATGQGRVPIYASSDSTFYLKVVEARLTFHRNEEGEVDAVTLHQNGHHRAKRLWEPAWVPSPEVLAMYLGRYFSEELEAFYEVALNDEDELVLRHRRYSDIPLKAEAEDEYSGSFPIAGVQFIRNDEGLVTGFTASNGRSFGIVFEKQP